MLNLALAVVLQNPVDTISFQSNFEPVEKVIERLARESQTPMTSFSGIKNYPIYINVKNVPLQTLMDKIAEVTGAEWERKKESWFLSAGTDVRKKQEKAGDPEIIAAIEGAIVEASKPKKKLEDFKAPAEQGKEPKPEDMRKMITDMMGAMFGADPATLSLIKIIGAKDLSTIIEGRRVVLSNNPNPMQVLMNSEAINAIRKFIQEEAAQAIAAKKEKETKKSKDAANKSKAKAKAKSSDDTGDDMDEDFDMEDFNMGQLFGGGGTIQNPELANKLSTIMASFQINARSNLSVQLSAFTDTGKPLYSKAVQLPIQPINAALAAVKGKTKLAVTPSAKAYAQALLDGENIDPIASMVMSMGQGTATMFENMFSEKSEAEPPDTKPLSPETKAMILDPIKHEPLAALLGPVLDGVAANGRNVVALPSDAVFKTLAREVVKQDLTVEGVLDQIDRTITQQVSQDGTWTVVKASSPLELRSAFCNRVALKALLDTGNAKGYLNLDDCARFAVVQDSHRGSESLALPMITAALRTSDIGSISALTAAGFDALKFYSTMTDFQKQTLNANRPLALATLSPAQKDILGRMVYSGGLPPMESNNELWKSISEVGASEEDQMGGMAAMGLAMAGPMMSAFGMGETKMSNERTILLPNGIPVVGSINLKTFNSQSLLAIDKSKGTATIAPPEMLAMGEQDMGFMKIPKRNFDGYQLANQQTFMLFFQFGNAASYILPLYDVKVDSSKTYKKTDLPSKLQERLKGFVPPPPAVASPPDKDGGQK